MSPAQSNVHNKKAEGLYDEAMAAYNRWDVEEAIAKLEQALELVPNNVTYHMRMAQVLSRAGDFDRALRSLANYLRLEPDSPISMRIERLFGSGMDNIEEVLTSRMTAEQMPIKMIGAVIQMWMEFRIVLGEDIQNIKEQDSAIWAAALDYTVRKVNLYEVSSTALAKEYKIDPESLRAYHKKLVKLLDIMPCDYRYFIGDDNPLDKLVEAAEMLEKLEARFKSE